MAVLISLGGKSAGDGFLVAPVGATYDAEIAVSTDSGTLPVTLQASPNTAGLVFSQTNLTLSTTPTVVNVPATLQSTARGDTTIQVLDGATPVANSGTSAISPFTHKATEIDEITRTPDWRPIADGDLRYFRGTQ